MSSEGFTIFIQSHPSSVVSIVGSFHQLTHSSGASGVGLSLQSHCRADLASNFVAFVGLGSDRQLDSMSAVSQSSEVKEVIAEIDVEAGVILSSWLLGNDVFLRGNDLDSLLLR